jgi:hypothetical protein
MQGGATSIFSLMQPDRMRLLLLLIRRLLSQGPLPPTQARSRQRRNGDRPIRSPPRYMHTPSDFELSG